VILSPMDSRVAREHPESRKHRRSKVKMVWRLKVAISKDLHSVGSSIMESTYYGRDWGGVQRSYRQSTLRWGSKNQSRSENVGICWPEKGLFVRQYLRVVSAGGRAVMYELEIYRLSFSRTPIKSLNQC
jgi:hypothetical protein